MFKCNDALESVTNTLMEGHSLTILMVIQSNCAVALDALVGTTLDHSPFGHLLIGIRCLVELISLSFKMLIVIKIGFHIVLQILVELVVTPPTNCAKCKSVIHTPY